MKQCPAIRAKCFNCSRIGHFTRLCRSKKQVNLDTTSTSEVNNNVNDYVMTLKTKCHSVSVQKTIITAKVKPLSVPHGTNNGADMSSDWLTYIYIEFP